jgi:hypothetical protein
MKNASLSYLSNFVNNMDNPCHGVKNPIFKAGGRIRQGGNFEHPLLHPYGIG